MKPRRELSPQKRRVAGWAGLWAGAWSASAGCGYAFSWMSFHENQTHPAVWVTVSMTMGFLIGLGGWIVGVGSAIETVTAIKKLKLHD